MKALAHRPRLHSRRRHRRRRNPGPSAGDKLLRSVIVFGAGFGGQALVNYWYQKVESEPARVQRYGQNQIGAQDVLLRLALPLGGAFVLAMKTGLVSGGAFFAGALANSGGVTLVDGWLPLLGKPKETATDLGPYGAPGFAWDRTSQRVYAIQQGPVLGYAGNASTLNEAFAVAQAFFG